ncbi:MAG: flavin reductase [Bacilli bacterium]|nr:flavin reductase [Bacilli bacterium]
MSLRAFKCGANVITLTKNGKKLGMTCAWSTMLDYDKVGMLLGSQSITGKNIEINDLVGVSSLSKNQKDIALLFGDNHSDTYNKFAKVEYLVKNNAILIQGAKVQMICKVKQILHLFEKSSDVFLVLDVIESSSDTSKEFLSLDDVFPEK